MTFTSRKITKLKLFTLILSAYALTGCEPPPPHPQIQILDSAVKSGKFTDQIAALNILVDEGKPENQANYQQSLDMITHVTKLNQQAIQQLDQDKFAALELAIKADNLRFNTDSRRIIGEVLRPYLGFYDILPRLQQWSYPELSKVVIAGVMPPPASRWQQPLTMPHTWPNNMLFKSLQTKEAKLAKLWGRLANERQELVEIVRLIGIMKNKVLDKSQPDEMLENFYQDAIDLNNLYNLVITDYLWHYYKLAIEATINANQQIIKDAKIAIQDKQTAAQWLVDYQLSKNIAIERLSGCCHYFSKPLQNHFAHLESPNQYNQSLQQVIKQFSQLTKNNFSEYQNQQQAIKQLTHNNQQLQQWLEQVESLAEQQPRRQVAVTFLQTYYRWQQGDYQQLEQLMPQLRQYQNAVSRF